CLGGKIQNRILIKIVKGLVGLFILISAQRGYAQQPSALGELALFNRCYSHITQTRLPRAHPLRGEVISGRLSAADACLQVLNSAQLVASGSAEGRLAADNETSRRILKTFNDLHRSWFPNDDILIGIPEGVEFYPRTPQLYDEAESALHVTRALLTEGVPYSEVATSDQAMEALRASGPIRDSALADNERLKTRSAPNGDTSVTMDALLVQTGELLGVRRMSLNPEKLNKTVNSSTDIYLNSRYISPTLTIPFNQSFGAGIAGTRSYLLLNLGRPDSLPMNGGLRLARRWSKAVMKDLLCRDLPAVRNSDAIAHVQGSLGPSTPPFRGNVNCMACHATIDPLAGVVRNLSFIPVPFRTSGGVATAHIYQWATDRAPETGTVDDDYEFYRRPTNGNLYYRSYNGTLINKPVASVPELGRALAEADDLYVCAASRYLQFFTGIGVNLQDEGDPQKPALSSGQAAYRRVVTQLAAELKRHQSLKLLIHSILKSDIYRSSNLRLPGDGGSQ
ncbi:MAG TPA: hypothetical protein VFV50_11420, partial [Bdellovibrionales bacterium]|nr:hypothetical protein [Bdellovibrionales bacterium]